MYTTAFLDLPPLLSAGGTVRLPGSKSISNRVLLLAGLSEGTTVVHDLLASDDTHVMLEALRTLGFEVQLPAESQGEAEVHGGPCGFEAAGKAVPDAAAAVGAFLFEEF